MSYRPQKNPTLYMTLVNHSLEFVQESMQVRSYKIMSLLTNKYFPGRITST